MPVQDAEMTRAARREISRRYIDSSQLDVRVMHGVVYLRGRIKPLRTHKDVDLKEEIGLICRILKQRPGIRDVVNEIEMEHDSKQEKKHQGYVLPDR